MASGPATQGGSTLRDHTFHVLRISRVVTETADARTFVLDVPAALRSTFAYRAGQFCNFRADVHGESRMRCYSMSSAPGVDDELQVTVKRVPGGVFSNWMIDALGAGAEIEVAPPTGFFTLTEDGGDVVAFAAGSGITPVFSLVKAALTATERRVRLLYANRDRASVIFARELEALARAHGDRLAVVHHLDVEDGFVGPEAVHALVDGAADASCYVCGPEPFMDVVERTLLDRAVEAARIHIERFTAAEVAVPLEDAPPEPGAAIRVTIDLDGRTEAGDHHPGATILQTARQLGLAPPSSCESGSCATCMAHLDVGEATMRTNNALTPEEVDGGWVLTCQAVPTSPVVHVVYGFD